ncbi:esterase-like activity of phytase family protein [Novosphingobium mangrovi (ex Hu et al. 2023)]|uniref:Esterase-like activity of phytase family protein n=1 Tax=Novosphingobium mangrovi (ex Hu et al. 2023) TaxID=2930094 RepID=A0ABT0AHW6_9SPHN|nr:esterase-like activity of phytase family protein [Novosphingobium mangrovi (ex Hu et al. 2023)]MCJ1962791.1 esterase-like activity of phytase family protein [Novosphingobium mangrovi (ex Hu et al. 2023)]
MLARIASLILLAGLVVPIWVRSPQLPDPEGNGLVLVRQRLPDRGRLARDLGPLRLEGAWQLSGARAGGYSALVPIGDDQLLAISDGGMWLHLSMRAGAPFRHAYGKVGLATRSKEKEDRDVESAFRDLRSGAIWLGMEGVNAIARTDAQLREEKRVKPAAMRDWDVNSGPEAMTRLRDGRFLVLRETPTSGTGGRLHDAVLFDGDPVEGPQEGGKAQRLQFAGARNFSAVDAATLPDGRVLVLMRRLVWPAPLTFAGRIVIADPRDIVPGETWTSQEVAVLASDMPLDNFEGMAVREGAQGRVEIWLISDDNFMRHWQSTLLWKLSVDPAQLPCTGASKPAR